MAARVMLCGMIMLLGAAGAGCGSSDGSKKESGSTLGSWPDASSAVRNSIGGKFPRLTGTWESPDPKVPRHVDELNVENNGEYEHYFGDGTNIIKTDGAQVGTISAVAGQRDTYAVSCTLGACDKGALVSLTLDGDKMRARTSEGDERIFTWTGALAEIK
ncbi:MAG: hypothetical protein ACRDQZ_06810 [Mycobacteriales bacterium]